MNVENAGRQADDTLSAAFETQDQIVLILCGLIASGKSTFAEALQTYFPQFRRCNQDDSGSRKEVERLARLYLRQRFSICIDRTNFNAEQRAHWIRIAHEYPGTLVWIIVLDTPFEVCAERLRLRTSHPTIKSYEEGLPILAHFAQEFQYPTPDEGYHRILHLQPFDLPSLGPLNTPSSILPSTPTLVTSEALSGPAACYSRSDISAILCRLRDSAPIIPPNTALNLHSHNHPFHNSSSRRITSDHTYSGPFSSGIAQSSRPEGWNGRGSGSSSPLPRGNPNARWTRGANTNSHPTATSWRTRNYDREWSRDVSQTDEDSQRPYSQPNAHNQRATPSPTTFISSNERGRMNSRGRRRVLHQNVGTHNESRGGHLANR